MFKFQEVWFPDGERHFPEWMAKNGEMVDGRGTYQIKKLRAAMEHVKNFGTAVDVGAHVGLWSMRLLKHFRNVFAYEPVPQFRECFIKNVDPDDWEERAVREGWGRGGAANNVELFPYALGSRSGGVRMRVNPADTGGTCVDGMGETPMVRLDDQFLHQPGAVDFIKIDCEGYEIEVLKGAEGLLRAARPCVIVEQKERCLRDNYGMRGTPAVEMLREMGAKLRREMGGDYIMSWDA